MKMNGLGNWSAAAPPGVRPQAASPAQRPEAVIAGFVRVLERLSPPGASPSGQGNSTLAGRIFQEKP